MKRSKDDHRDAELKEEGTTALAHTTDSAVRPLGLGMGTGDARTQSKVRRKKLFSVKSSVFLQFYMSMLFCRALRQSGMQMLQQ